MSTTLITLVLICTGMAVLAVKLYRNIPIVSTLTVIRQCRQCGWCQATNGHVQQQIFPADHRQGQCETSGHNFEFVHLPAKASYLQKLIGVNS